MIRIISLDPGRTTGFALAFVEDYKPFIAYSQDALSHKEFWTLLYSSYNGRSGAPSALHVICESFHFRRGKTGIDLYPCELIGVLHYFVAQHPPVRLYFQEPSVQGKHAYFTDAKLKEMRLYQKEFEHGRSAVKHLLHWLQFGHGASFEPDMDQCELVTIPWTKEKIA